MVIFFASVLLAICREYTDQSELNHSTLVLNISTFHTLKNTSWARFNLAEGYCASRHNAVSKVIQNLEELLQCNQEPNPHTNHIRLPDIIRNITVFQPGDGPRLFNPTIIALPSWSENQYLLVTRFVTEGLHQESLICEANEYHTSDNGEGDTSNDLRCVTPPKVLNIPPTPAEECSGEWQALVDIPGFHDPRIFWSGKGEPLIIVNSQ